MTISVAPPVVPSDSDPAETQDWLDALASVVREVGDVRARFLLWKLEEQGQHLGITVGSPPYSAYRNSIPLERQGSYPGNLAMEERITAIVRWNALAMVMRGNAAYGDLGGMSRASPPRPRSSRSASTISSGPARRAAAT